MAAPAKFTFDLDLGRHSGGGGALMAESTVASLIEDARQAARSEGFAEGERSAIAKAARQTSAAAAALAEQAAHMVGAVDAAQTEIMGEAVTLAVSVARKFAAHLVARQPVGEIEALVADCLASLDGVPHLVIRCTPALADAVRDQAKERLAVSGFAGRLVVMGDPEIAPGDARIEWADGGLVRDSSAIAAAVDARIAAYFAARGITPPETES